MKILACFALCVALVACNGRFNWYDRLLEEPTKTELIGGYTLKMGDDAAEALIKMGYTEIDGSIELKEDGTFSAKRIPGCGVHGWDERTYPFTGGLYSFCGTWSIVKNQTVYDVKLEISDITEHTGLKIDDKEMSRERTPPSSINLSLLRGNSIDVGFELFNGDFWPLQFKRDHNYSE